MNVNKRVMVFMAVISACFVLPGAIQAATFPQQRTFTGVVTKIYSNQITVKTSSAASYTAETGNAVLTRKNGAAMQFSEIIIGDKVEVRGTLWNDNSMNASYVRNMSLYVHNGTFSGKITGLNLGGSSFTLESRSNGVQTIRTDSLTVFKKNSKNSSLAEMDLGISAVIKGVWDRNSNDVLAKLVEATVRLVNIDFTGTITMKNGNSLTVLGENNVIYGVDVSSSKFLKKNGKAANFSQFNIGDSVRIHGKHVSESFQITGTTVKDLSILK